MKRLWIIWVPLAFLVGLAASCSEDETAMGPVKMPKKEATWVRTEKVRTTKQEVLDGVKRNKIDVSTDQGLLKKLTDPGESRERNLVVDEKTCMARAKVLNQERTTVQKKGGLWHAFERVEDFKIYSDTGMQLDSHINKMVFALVHLCKTAQGVPLTERARKVLKNIEAKGPDKVREEFIELGVAPADSDIMLDYAEFARSNEKRVVPYETLEGLLHRATPVVRLYFELSTRKPDGKNREAFLTDAATLLQALKQNLSKDPTLVMALREDTEIPFENLTGLGDL
ncbi:MAG: hypothetical protein VX667_08805 [Nitrospinota bacterium]|nr:hypothetical protein [Nitrospinota bacterium]